MDSGTTTKARPRRIARVSCRRSVLDFSHSLRVRSVSKVNGLAAVVFGIRMTADLARVSLREEKYRLVGLWTGLWSYGTELRAGVTSPESNLFTHVCTVYLTLRARSGGAEAPWRDRSVGYNSQHM